MAVIWEVVARITRTKLGKTEREFFLRRFGKIVKRRWSLVAAIAKKEEERVAAKTLLMLGSMAARAAELYPRFAKKYDFVGKLTQQEWAEAVARTLRRGGEDTKQLRGLIVERLLPTMKQMDALYADLVKVAKAKGWGEPSLVSGVRTLDGREIADWMIVSEHKDGRVWIMALVESKSISTTIELVAQKKKPVGQHLWDVFRAKSGGIRIERFEKGSLKFKSYPGEKVVAGVAPAAGTGKETLTRFIGVTPEDLTPAQLDRLSAQSVKIEFWLWPVDEKQMLKMLRELIDAVSG